ncbi:MAG: DUF2807 domain-containing protein [Fimbriimonadaceae bacterium]|nr:DUF2807 domain-containing protein [Chthonomonadaceae bacterium]MCO5295391.1 DUF2807 domain-containing protein [Fimbriimonadaceae bacterium]
MIKSLVALAAVATMAGGCGVVHVIDRISDGGPRIEGSGKAASEVRQVSDFKGIVVEGATDVVAKVGPKVSVKVEGDDNIVPKIITKVEDGKLVITCEESYSSRTPLKVTVTAPSLEEISVKGSANAVIDGVKCSSFSASIAGSGDVTVRGTADSVDASIAGSGDMDLSGLKAKNADVSISGSGDVSVFATESLEGAIAGSGDIAYSGNPGKVERSIVGSGEIHAAG